MYTQHEMYAVYFPRTTTCSNKFGKKHIILQIIASSRVVVPRELLEELLVVLVDPFSWCRKIRIDIEVRQTLRVKETFPKNTKNLL